MAPARYDHSGNHGDFIVSKRGTSLCSGEGWTTNMENISAVSVNGASLFGWGSTLLSWNQGSDVSWERNLASNRAESTQTLVSHDS
eukprot:scaffold16982_cov92-Amphora_coffeaeformis.AAC.1